MNLSLQCEIFLLILEYVCWRVRLLLDISKEFSLTCKSHIIPFGRSVKCNALHKNTFILRLYFEVVSSRWLGRFHDLCEPSFSHFSTCWRCNNSYCDKLIWKRASLAIGTTSTIDSSSEGHLFYLVCIMMRRFANISITLLKYWINKA